MKVKISYTIDFNEVPTKVARLSEETLGNLILESTELAHNIERLKDDNLFSTITKIQDFRQQLMKYDMQLADYVGLLSNYEKTKLEIVSTVTEHEEEEADEST